MYKYLSSKTAIYIYGIIIAIIILLFIFLHFKTNQINVGNKTNDHYVRKINSNDNKEQAKLKVDIASNTIALKNLNSNLSKTQTLIKEKQDKLVRVNANLKNFNKTKSEYGNSIQSLENQKASLEKNINTLNKEKTNSTQH